MNLVNGLPKYENSRVFSIEDIETARMNNQFILKGSNPSFIDKVQKIYLFIEYVAAQGGVVLKDQDSVAFSGTVYDVSFEISPLRVDGGIITTGTVDLIKGFYLY